jgi:hypothetical protein
LKKVIHKSVIPIYVAAGLWLAACLFLPMYRLWHYLLYAAVAAAGYFVAQRFFPGTVEEVEAPPAPPNSGDQEVDQLLLEGRSQLTEMKQLGRDIPAVSAQVERLSALTEKIFTALETDVSRLPRTRKFLSYYLPTTVQLLRRYQELDRQGSGSNVTTALEKIKAMLSTVEAAYQKQLDNLYEAQAMDITADIRVMEQMMAAEGLLSDDTQL